MLIAIMTEVFELVTSRKQQSSLTEMIELLNDFRVFLNKFSLGIDAQFLFLITPSQKNSLEESAEEQLTSVKESLESQSKGIQDRQDMINESTGLKFESIKNEMHEVNTDIDNKLNNMKERIGNLDGKIETLTELLHKSSMTELLKSDDGGK
jgi:archaellum component FlaC